MQSRATLNNTSKLYWKILQVSILLVFCSIYFTLKKWFIYPFPISNPHIWFISDLDNDIIYLPIQRNLRIFHFLQIWIIFIFPQISSYSIYRQSSPMIDLSPYYINLRFWIISIFRYINALSFISILSNLSFSQLSPFLWYDSFTLFPLSLFYDINAMFRWYLWFL